jgi:hypothetical protein
MNTSLTTLENGQVSPVGQDSYEEVIKAVPRKAHTQNPNP